MKSRMIVIGNSMIGIEGFDEILSQLFHEGREPSEDLKEDLLERVGKKNYIPKGSEDEYAAAFLREYENFVKKRKTGNSGSTRSPVTWRGIPREEIPWFPAIIEEMCNGCKVCLTFCPYQVFDWDQERQKVNVANPYNCLVGCSTCSLKCKPKAIMFPPLEFIDNLLKQSRRGG